MSLPKPYFKTKDGLVTLYCGDNRNILPYLEPQSFPLVLTDPPYTDEVHDNSKRSYSGETKAFIDFNSITEQELREIFDMIGRVAKGWVIATMADDHTYMFKKAPPQGLRFIRAGVWVKPNTAAHVNEDRPAQGWESIAHFHVPQDGKFVWHGGNHSSVYIHNFVTGKNQRTEGNKTAKPRPLYSELIRFHSNPGDTLLDPFCGVGTSLYVARMLGRKSVGIEIDEKQCEAIAQVMSQDIMELVA